MSIELKPEIQEIIKSHVSMGIYADVDDVILKALKLLAEWEQEVRKKVEISVEQLNKGEGIDLDIVVARLQEKLRKAREESLVIIDPATLQPQRPTFGVMKGSGEILGDVITPVIPVTKWESFQ